MMVLHFYQGQMLHGTPTAEYLGARRSKMLEYMLDHEEGQRAAVAQRRVLGAVNTLVDEAKLDQNDWQGTEMQGNIHDKLKAPVNAKLDHDKLLRAEAQNLDLGTLKTLKLDHDELLGAEAQKLVLGTVKTLKLDHDELLGMMELQLIQRRLDVVDSARLG